MSEITAAREPSHRDAPRPQTYLANPGVRVPAPIIHMIFLALGVGLYRLDRSLLFDPSVASWLAASLVIGVSGISFFCTYQFARAGTSMLPNHPSNHLITVGPYRFSRNPIYLSLVVLHVGIGVWINSGWVVASVLPCIAILDRWLIVREERYLAQRFGADYRRYAERVRRWI